MKTCLILIVLDTIEQHKNCENGKIGYQIVAILAFLKNSYLYPNWFFMLRNMPKIEVDNVH